MAREKEEKAAEKEAPRGLGEGEAVERTKVNPQETDIFEEVLKGKKTKIDEVKAAVDKNEDEIMAEDKPEEFEEEDEEEDDATGGQEQEKEDESGPKKRGRKPKKVKEEPAEEKPEMTEEKDKQAGSDNVEKPDNTADEKAHDPEGIGEEDREPDEWNDEEFDYDVDHDAKEPEELKAPAVPAKEELRNTILEKAKAAAEGSPEFEETAEKLAFLSAQEQKAVFIGRKAGIYKKYGFEGALNIGRVQEKEFDGWNVHLDSLNPHVVFVCGARGSGKCLTGDTLITLDNGEIVPIKELEAKQEKVFCLGSSLNIETAARTEFFKRTVNKTLKVRLQNGKEIELTPEHPLLTVNGWVAAEDLSAGDRIATPRVIPAFGNKKMKGCDVKLLGYLIAEGHLGNQFVLFSNFDKKIVAEFKESVIEFDANLRIEKHSKPGCFRVAQVKKKVDLSHIVRDATSGRFTSKGYIKMEKSSIRQWLESIGLYGKLSGKKFIPKEVMRLEEGQLALFLNRLFSCDGSIYRINRSKNWSVSIGFSSERMTREVQHLLLRFGILSTFRKKKTKCNGKVFDNYEIVTYGENTIKFVDEIGFFGKKEKRALTALEEMSGVKRNPNFDTIPKEIWQKFKPYNAKEMSRKLGYKSNWFHSAKSYAPSREKLLKMAQFEQNIGIQVLANSDIYWDTIKEIKETHAEQEVYDITVPLHHNFVANDIIVHNSYVLGVIAEELAEKNRNVGIIVVDPIGVFWSMRFPNKEEKEIEKLREQGLEPKGLANLKVFIPEGMKGQVPKSTYDAGFSIQPSLLTGEDWALTFGVDRFSVSGLLLDKVLKKVEGGYKKQADTKNDSEGGKARPQKELKVAGKGKNYSLTDLIECLETDSELNSREKGYKQDSIRAIISRFEAAKSWGIFHEKGTPLGELSRENQMTILDTSFLEDNVTALVIGILARRLLAARKISTRKEAASKFKSLNMNELLELEIPPTWLFIDEAHTLIPSGNEVTAATAGIIEYVKQGRRPGLSLVFATQQPSAINTKVLSQLDVIMSHKLIFDDDIKAVIKRTPTIMPRRYRNPNFIKTLPVGVAITGDRREETSRAFVMGIRPRKSQHEGRDAETTGLSEQVDSGQVEKIAVEMLLKNVKEEKSVDIEKARMALETLNSKYRTNVDFDKVLRQLEDKGIVVGKDAIMLEGYVEKEAEVSLEKSGGKENDEEGTVDDELDEERQALGVDGESDLVPIKRKSGEESLSVGEEAEGPSLEETEVTGQAGGGIELLALPQRIGEDYAREVVEKVRHKRLFGILGNVERIESIRLRYLPIWRVKFDSAMRRGEFISRECFVNSMTGEFVHFKAGDFFESKGLKHLGELGEEETRALKALQARGLLIEEVMAQTELDEAKTRRVLQKLLDRGIAGKHIDKKSGKGIYFMKEKFDLPPNERHELLGSLSELPFVKTEALSVERESYGKEQVAEVLRKLWGRIIVKKIEPLYKPVWHIVLSEDAKERVVLIDAVNGKIIGN